jgi:hypothetical protein
MLLCWLVSLSRQCLLNSREVAMPTLSMERGKLNPASWFCCWSTRLKNEVGSGHHSAQSTINRMVRFDGLRSLTFQPQLIWSNYSWMGWEIGPEWATSAPSKKSRSGISWMGWNCPPGVSSFGQWFFFLPLSLFFGSWLFFIPGSLLIYFFPTTLDTIFSFWNSYLPLQPTYRPSSYLPHSDHCSFVLALALLHHQHL